MLDDLDGIIVPGGFSVGNAFEKFPLVVLTHIADLQATYLDEVDDEEG